MDKLERRRIYEGSTKNGTQLGRGGGSSLHQTRMAAECGPVRLYGRWLSQGPDNIITECIIPETISSSSSQQQLRETGVTPAPRSRRIACIQSSTSWWPDHAPHYHTTDNLHGKKRRCILTCIVARWRPVREWQPVPHSRQISQPPKTLQHSVDLHNESSVFVSTAYSKFQ